MREETFEMQDKRFSVALLVPAEMDTFYSWVDVGDNSCDFQRKYRFSDSRYPIVEESGFFPDLPDSSYSLTFWHIDKYDCRDVATGKFLDQDTLVMRLQAISNTDSLDFRLIGKSIEEIGGITYNIIKYSMCKIPQQKYPTTSLRAEVFVDSVELFVWYECASSDCKEFVPRMEKSMRSIRIQTRRP